MRSHIAKLLLRQALRISHHSEKSALLSCIVCKKMHYGEPYRLFLFPHPHKAENFPQKMLFQGLHLTQARSLLQCLCKASESRIPTCFHSNFMRAIQLYRSYGGPKLHKSFHAERFAIQSYSFCLYSFALYKLQI